LKLRLRFAVLVPVIAFLVSLILLLPFRGELATQVLYTLSPLSTAQPAPPSGGGPEERRYAQVSALNLPALIAELPVGLLSADHTTWTPDGMDFRVWRALSYPVLALIFWWLIGRGFDALRNDGRTLRWGELTLAMLLFASGSIFCVGWFVATSAEDRSDLNLHWMGIGVVLWLVLEAVPLTIGIRQRIGRRRKA
jgi:hypothetical protein